MSSRRIQHVLNMNNEIINQRAPEYLNKLIQINENNTRFNRKLMIQRPPRNKFKTSFYVRIKKIIPKINVNK